MRLATPWYASTARETFTGPLSEEPLLEQAESPTRRVNIRINICVLRKADLLFNIILVSTKTSNSYYFFKKNYLPKENQ